MPLEFGRLLEDASRDFDYVSRVKTPEGQLIIVVVAKEVIEAGKEWQPVATKKIEAGEAEDGPYGVEARVGMSDFTA